MFPDTDTDTTERHTPRDRAHMHAHTHAYTRLGILRLCLLNVFSSYRMCSLTTLQDVLSLGTECVLFLQDVFSYYTTGCALLVQNEFS